MFGLFGHEYNLKNIYLLSHNFIKNKPIQDSIQLKPYYLQFLEHHQPKSPINYSPDIYINDEKIELKLKNAYHQSSLNDLGQQEMIADSFSTHEKENLKTMVTAGYEYLTSNDHKLKAVFDLAIHSVFFRKTAKSLDKKHSYGGSSSTAMGVIWISGHKPINKYDMAEFLLHELTHHLLFIDERCHAQFNYVQMIKPENYAQSAILLKKRPLDKVVHSIVVGTEIIIARNKYLNSKDVGIHPDTVDMKNNILSSINDVLSIKTINDIITRHTRNILENCQDLIMKSL